MFRYCLLLALALLMPAHGSPNPSASQPAPQTITADAPAFTDDGRLIFPANYREWIFLTSGVDMSYSPRFNSAAMGHSMFDNVFVNPSAYKAFLEIGTWPDKTMLVLEERGAGSNASINKSGHFQTTELMGMEVHLRDQRLPAQHVDEQIGFCGDRRGWYGRGRSGLGCRRRGNDREQGWQQ